MDKINRIKKSEYDAYNLDKHPSIHYTGSVKGMINLRFWKPTDSLIRCGNYIYNTSILIW